MAYSAGFLLGNETWTVKVEFMFVQLYAAGACIEEYG